MNADRTVLTDAMWARIEPMLPGRATDPGATAADNRRFVEAVLLAVPHGVAVARPSGALRQLEQCVQAVPPLGATSIGRFRACLTSRFVGGMVPADSTWVFVDGTVVQAHQKAAGAKGGPAARGSAAPGAA